MAKQEIKSKFLFADGSGGIELGELDAFGSHSIEIGSGDGRMAEAAHVAIPHVVCEDDDDVGFSQGIFTGQMRRCEAAR